MARQCWINYLISRLNPARLGNDHPKIVPYQVFDTADAPMILATGIDGQFREFCDCVGLPNLAFDPRCATRVAHVERRKRPRSDWPTLPEAIGVPCGPVNNLD